MKINQGIDIVNVSRMKRAVNRSGKKFLNRVFTLKEQVYCESKKMKFEHYAARFAAKEAVMKSLGIDLENSYRFSEIEILRYPTGKPYVYLSKIAKKHFKPPKNSYFELSMAHERKYAIATAFLVVP